MSESALSAPPVLSFGPFVLDAANATLQREGAAVELAPKAFEVLCFLAQRPGRLVSKDDLLDAVWGRRFVSESVLKTVVSQLRAALGDDARHPRYIETAARRGYRFLGETAQAAPASPPAPAAPASTAPGNIAPALAPLHGRGADIAALCKLLDAHRLVSITGTGGIGKTRLALALAQQRREGAPDGVWLVELDALTDADELPGAIVRALGLNHEAARSVDALARALRPLSVLLLLDNCEHLVEPVATLLAALLPQAPRLQVLATSQERLHLPEEQVYALGPLALPADAADASPERFGAVALFVARVAAAKPEFRLGDDNRDAAIEICRALDGVPLAIELAAARVPLLGVAGVLERLGERLTLLSQGARNVPARHRTLLAAIEWSHGLLSPDEQTVFRRLAVFAGGFSLEAAQQVVAANDLNPWAVLDALGALVDKSLLQLVDHGDARRARLLDSARSYALEHLRESGEELALRRAHLRWMHETMRAIDTDIYARPELPMLRALPELENLRAAMRFASGPDGDRALAIELAGFSAVFGLGAGIKLEVRAWLERVRPWLDDADRSVWQRGLFQYAVASLGSVGVAYSQDETMAAGRLAVEALRQTDDAFRLSYALYALSVVLRRAGSDERHALIAEMVALERDDWPLMTKRFRRWTEMGELRARGELEQVRRLWQTEIAISKAANSTRNVWMSMWSLALVERDLGLLDDAIARVSEAVDLVRENAAMRSNAMLVAFKAVLLIERGEIAPARAAVREAVPLMLADGILWWMADAIALLPALEGRLEDAARLHGWSDAMVRRHAPGARRAKDWQADYDRLHAQLAAAFEADALQQLMTSGEGLDEDAAALLLRLE